MNISPDVDPAASSIMQRMSDMLTRWLEGAGRQDGREPTGDSTQPQDSENQGMSENQETPEHHSDEHDEVAQSGAVASSAVSGTAASEEACGGDGRTDVDPELNPCSSEQDKTAAGHVSNYGDPADNKSENTSARIQSVAAEQDTMKSPSHEKADTSESKHSMESEQQLFSENSQDLPSLAPKIPDAGKSQAATTESGSVAGHSGHRVSHSKADQTLSVSGAQIQKADHSSHSDMSDSIAVSSSLSGISGLNISSAEAQPITADQDAFPRRSSGGQTELHAQQQAPAEKDPDFGTDPSKDSTESQKKMSGIGSMEVSNPDTSRGDVPSASALSLSQSNGAGSVTEYPEKVKATVVEPIINLHYDSAGTCASTIRVDLNVCPDQELVLHRPGASPGLYPSGATGQSDNSLSLHRSSATSAELLDVAISSSGGSSQTATQEDSVSRVIPGSSTVTTASVEPQNVPSVEKSFAAEQSAARTSPRADFRELQTSTTEDVPGQSLEGVDNMQSPVSNPHRVAESSVRCEDRLEREPETSPAHATCIASDAGGTTSQGAMSSGIHTGEGTSGQDRDDRTKGL